MTYLNDRTTGGRQHAYVHVAHAPLGGGRHEHDHWSTTVVSEASPERGPDAFRFEVPGSAAIDERCISVTLPEVALVLDRQGPLVPWFPEPDAEASPFVGPGAAPGGSSHWFVQTLGSPATWRYEDGDGRRDGDGLLYVERGWSVRQAHGFCYLMAVSPTASVVVAGGMADDTARVWAGRVLTDRHDITFLPFAGDTTIVDEVDPGAGRVAVDFHREHLEVRIRSSASPDDLYDQITPSLTVFHADQPVAKTMQAELTLEVHERGVLVEAVTLPQSIFELGGVLHPPTAFERPTYRYPGER